VTVSSLFQSASDKGGERDLSGSSESILSLFCQSCEKEKIYDKKLHCCFAWLDLAWFGTLSMYACVVDTTYEPHFRGGATVDGYGCLRSFSFSLTLCLWRRVSRIVYGE